MSYLEFLIINGNILLPSLFDWNMNACAELSLASELSVEMEYRKF